MGKSSIEEKVGKFLSYVKGILNMEETRVFPRTGLESNM